MKSDTGALVGRHRRAEPRLVDARCRHGGAEQHITIMNKMKNDSSRRRRRAPTRPRSRPTSRPAAEPSEHHLLGLVQRRQPAQRHDRQREHRGLLFARTTGTTSVGTICGQHLQHHPDARRRGFRIGSRLEHGRTGAVRRGTARREAAATAAGVSYTSESILGFKLSSHDRRPTCQDLDRHRPGDHGVTAAGATLGATRPRSTTSRPSCRACRTPSRAAWVRWSMPT